MDRGRGRSHNRQSFPDYYYNNRSAPYDVPHGGSAESRGFHLARSGSDSPGRDGSDMNEVAVRRGPPRRRTSIACARCRKRKIRCSGDRGDGSRCQSCKHAGVELGSCHFHRVSTFPTDQIQGVLKHYTLAQSVAVANPTQAMTIYSPATDEPTHRRLGTSQSYPALGMKTMDPSTWTVAYSEDTSPVETYGLEQPTPYLPNDVPVPNSSLFGSPYRLTFPTARPCQQARNVYYDEEPYVDVHGLPYTPNKSRATVDSEPHSPMNMSSLTLTLPSGPTPYQYHATEGVTRQLPFPQPSPAQVSRNALDNMQDRRLRSSHGSSTIFTRPLQSWNSDSEALVIANTTAPIGNSTAVATATDGALNFLATAAIEGDTGTTGVAPSSQLKFRPSVFDDMIASTPRNEYSNFRDSRAQGQQPGYITRHGSQTNLYSYNTDNTSKRDSLCGSDSDDRKLVNGRQYVPLAHQQAQYSAESEILHQGSSEDGDVSLQSASNGSVNASF